MKGDTRKYLSRAFNKWNVNQAVLAVNEVQRFTTKQNVGRIRSRIIRDKVFASLVRIEITGVEK